MSDRCAICGGRDDEAHNNQPHGFEPDERELEIFMRIERLLMQIRDALVVVK